MVKHTQTIRRQTGEELFERVWPFCEIGAKSNLKWKIIMQVMENVTQGWMMSKIVGRIQLNYREALCF